MPSVQPQRLASLVKGPELQAALRAQDKHNSDIAQSLNRALVVGDSLQVLYPFTPAAPLVVPVVTPAIPGGVPYAFCQCTTGPTISSGANVVVNFDSKQVDSDAAVTTGSAWKFTVPPGKAGLYQVNSMVTLANATATANAALILTLLKNGSEFIRLQRLGNNDGCNWGLSGSTVLSLVAGDYLQVAFFQNTGVSRVLETNTTTNWVTVSCLQLLAPQAPSCFPFDVLWPNNTPPTVVIAQCLDASSASPSNLAASLTDWTLTTKGNNTLIHVRNIPGLLPGKSYAVTLVAF